ncbi:MAG: hypothetical protein HY321_08055 [Armatimonadetes bacterium]|nr:hypothetical protein [Armatimonadota bacterium]
MHPTIRRFSMLMLLSSLALGWASSGTRAEEGQARRQAVAILDFKDGIVPSELSGRKLGQICASLLAQELQTAGRYDVVERARMDEALKETKLQQAGIVAEGEAADLGKRLGADYLVYGQVDTAQVKKGAHTAGGFGLQLLTRVEGIHAAVRVSFTITETATGKIWKQKSIEATEDGKWDPRNPAQGWLDAMTGALRKTAVSIAQAMVPDVEGIVVEVDAGAGTFMTSLGALQGIAPGTYFRVYRKGREVKHPITGEVLSVQRVEVCRGKCTRAEEKISIAEAGEARAAGRRKEWRANKQKAAEVQVGDLVETIETFDAQ